MISPQTLFCRKPQSNSAFRVINPSVGWTTPQRIHHITLCTGMIIVCLHLLIPHVLYYVAILYFMTQLGTSPIHLDRDDPQLRSGRTSRRCIHLNQGKHARDVAPLRAPTLGDMCVIFACIYRDPKRKMKLRAISIPANTWPIQIKSKSSLWVERMHHDSQPHNDLKEFWNSRGLDSWRVWTTPFRRHRRNPGCMPNIRLIAIIGLSNCVVQISDKSRRCTKAAKVEPKGIPHRDKGSPG